MPKYAGQLATILFFLAAASCFVTAVLGSPAERATRTIIGGVCAGLAGAILFVDAVAGATERAERKVVTKETADHSVQKSRTKSPEIDLYLAVQEKTQNE